MALFNHAGIAPDQEASWTGLGWNLNPGAINRVVNGIPDDYSGQESSVRDQWSGGTTYNGQATFPLGNPALWQTLACSWDTYQGFGIDYMKTTMGIPGTPFSASLDSKGNLGASAGAGFGEGMVSGSVSSSVNIRTGKFNSSVDASLGKYGLGTGVSLSSEGGAKTWSNFGSVGLGNPVNNNYGKISTETHTIFNVGLASLERTQYWMDQSQATPQYGILNAGQTVATNTFTRVTNNLLSGIYV